MTVRDTQTTAANRTEKLRRSLTTPLLTLYGLGVTVGAGIYVLVGSTAAEAGAYAPVSFVVAAVVVAFTAFSYAELSTRYPVSAGEAAYIEAGFRSGSLATLLGLAVALSGMVSAAAVTIGAASYLQGLIGAPHWVLTIAVVVLMGIIALWGITQSVVVAAIITLVEVGGLIVVAGWGFGMSEPLGVDLTDMLPPLVGPHWMGIGAASLLAFFAFVGFEDMANVAEEVKDPVSTMPKAIVLTLVIATSLYLATTAAVLVAVPLDRLATSAAPLALVFDAAPGGVRQVFSVIAIVATINGVLIQMIMASRVLYGLADQGHLFPALAVVGTRTQTPVVATLLVMCVIACLALALPIEALAERTSQIVLSVFILVNAALFRLKWKGDDGSDHFRVPIIVPFLGALTSLLLFATAWL
ncbi:APC family permease [Maritimibacter alkaliphilus]|uniref:APC family permease n=1 Tax=Maritimibacter alkaliphilus TaxID=404236 RepID=UPI001C939D54|nr:APC family permease [Maritimibacter alkaliphilus]MBY6093110.1 APC family permease [Maritimibacter alkaliphilus]